MFRFEKLEVWQLAVALAENMYRVTKSFPADERLGLTNQLRRASVSVSSNIAEGSGRVSDKDFARFIEISYGSVMEIVSQCAIAHRQSLLSKESYDAIYVECESLARMLSGLRAALLQTHSQTHSGP